MQAYNKEGDGDGERADIRVKDGAALVGMRFGYSTHRWIGRSTYGTVEIWLSVCLVVLVGSAALWLDRAEAIHSRISEPTMDSGSVARVMQSNTDALPAVSMDRPATLSLIRTIWGEHWQLGVAIAECESALQADAIHSANADGSEDVGLFQINSIHGRSRDELRDPIANTRFAYSLFQAQSTAPWESSRLCWED